MKDNNSGTSKGGNQQTRNTNDSLDQALERLRDLHLNYKDLSSRCLVDISSHNKNDKRVFYFKPDTFLLDEPEKQRQYRDKLMKKITSPPTPEPIQFMADDLHRSLLETIQDKSNPSLCKKQLANFYKRRQYQLQHKKYKLLIRWAHHAIASENVERVGVEATHKYAKWEYDMENSIKRYERLDFEDGFDQAKTFKRPNTKAKEGGSLYVENSDLEPMSIIRQDDVEVYLRTVTYDQKISKLMTKFLARLKWLPLYRRFEIWSDSVESFNKIKEANIQRQEKMLEKIEAKGKAVIPPDHEDQLEEFQTILESYYIQHFKQKITNKAEKISSSMKSDHQMAPTMIGNILELKVQILDKSLDYGIYGDIELDQGYSFAYQITIFFPSYFQKQIIQSQFSLYDAFAGEEQDLNSVQKRNLQNMVKIDTNIFKDISTTSNNVPSQEFLNTDLGFQTVKVVRMKSSAYWIDYVCVFPKIPACIQRQAAFLTSNNPIDSLLRSAMNFLDVNDLATVNKILEETARLHQQQQKETSAEDKTKGGKKPNKAETATDEKPNMMNSHQNMKNHFQSAIKGEIGMKNETITSKIGPTFTNVSLRYLPQHLINAYYVLRHMKTRDYKIKLLYCLNYFRSVQKRMMLDLREFGTRERIYGDQVQPYIAPTEASRAAQRNVNTQFSKNLKEQQKINSISERMNKSQLESQSNSQNEASASISERQQQSYLRQAELSDQQEKIFSTINEDDEKQEQEAPGTKLYDMKQYKYKGKFCNKIYSTCPVIPRFHATFGEPVEFQPMNVEFERIGQQNHISDEGVKLLGRVDHFEINEKTREVHVKDDFGIYILYECSMQDMRDLEDELLKIGSFYISKHEYLVNTECERAYPLVDRITLLEDLLEKELDFQFEKVQLVQTYMETYEHLADPLEQQRLIQVVVDLMAQRPRLNLDASYFQDSYDTEKTCLQKHAQLMRTMIINQMKYEKVENKKIQGYLDLTLRLAQEHSKGKWKYGDAEDFFNELKRRKEMQAANGGEENKDNRGISNLSIPIADVQKMMNSDRKDQSMPGTSDRGSEMSATQKFLQKQVEKNHASKYNQQEQHEAQKQSQLSHKESEGGFAAVLGLPTITVETLYNQYKEKDEVILEIMNEHSNYVKLYEGYPDFHVDMQSLKSSKLSNYKFSDWSHPINVLDFFESLNFSSKFYASIQSVITELEEVHKPDNSSLLAMMEFKILERAEIEYQKVKAFYDGDLQEYKGQEFMEDDAIVGNPDKLIFHIKDMMSNLNKATKEKINPFIIGKLDVDTIAHFDFASLPKDQNQYMKPPTTLQEDFETAVKIAENTTKQQTAAQSRYFSQLKEYMRKINVPCMLNLYCNTVEMLRLRQELITTMSESMLLQEVYDSQAKFVNRPNFKPFFTDQVKFDNYLIDSSKVNFIDDGPGSNIEFDFAIKEFDNMLKSNINFRHPDSVKILINTSGLEELRGLLHYQIMHKQLLIIGTRMNQLVIDTHQRALTELEIARRGYCVPNSVIKIQNLFCKSGDGFSNEVYVKEKAKYMNNLSNNAPNVFYQLTLKKAKMRNTISKRFGTQLQTCAAQHRKTESCLRIMRAFKIRLIHIYCQEILRDAYHDAMKIQAIQSCQRLRTMSQVFAIDESVVGVMTFPNNRESAQVFKYEDHEFHENFFSAYNPAYAHDNQTKGHYVPSQGNAAPSTKAIHPVKMEIIDYQAIPSTITLMKCEALTLEEAQALTDRLPNHLDPKVYAPGDPLDVNYQQMIQQLKEKELSDQESGIKEILPTIDWVETEYPQAGDKDRSCLRITDFKQSYDYSQTQFGQIFSYYAFLERIMKFELSLNKINSSLVDALTLENAIYNGLSFWNIDPEASIAKKKHTESSTGQKLSEKVIEKIVNEKRAKINLAEDVVNLSGVIGTILAKAQGYYDQLVSGKTSANYVPNVRINEYMICHMEFRYYHLLHVIERLLDTYYQKGGIKEIKFLTDLHSQITKRDHVKVSFNHNAFHVNSAYTRPETISLESSNYFGYYANNEEEIGFQSCIQPTINEKALCPPQVTLFEGIYVPTLYKTTQYPGQIPHNPRVYPMLDTAFINFNDQERQYINSTLHSVKLLAKEYLEIINKEKLTGEIFEEGANIDHLKKSGKFLSDLVKARQLKVALMCWISSSTLPIDPQVYNQVFQQYKNDIFWKIMHKKDSLPPIGGVSPAELAAVPTKGGQSNDPNKKAEGSMVQNQQLMIMQAQVLVEQVQTCKAEIIVLQNEIQRNIINAAISAIESETAALANCFTMTATPIAQHIHPFQQFASTLYSKVDPNSHLDMVSKFGEVQRFITKLQNRGTEVETLTSGPGMVFTIKDFNECIQILCRGIIKYSEREMRARSENFAKKEAHYINMLYIKDRKIENLESRIANTQENLDKLINSKMYEKGNQLIYELDSVNRQLRLFKDNIFLMEKELHSKLRSDFQESLRRQRKDLDHAKLKFKDFKDDVALKVSADITMEKDYITKEITKRAEDYKNKEFGQEISPFKRAHPYKPTTIMSPNKSNFSGSSMKGGYHQSAAGYLDEIMNMTEIDARNELAEMWKEMRTLRMFWKTKEMLTKDKYEREIFVLKKQLTSNACLWEQLAESEKREKVLKQELVYTQQSLAASEKVIDKLKEDLRKSESDRIRLSQYKTSKAQRLEELESKVRKFEVMENINLEKLIDALGSKEKQIQKLKEIEKTFTERIELVERKKDHEIKEVKTSYFKELGMKKEVLERLEGLRMELRLLEKNEGSMTEVWKSKCRELVDICNKLKVENDSLRLKITQIAMNLSSYGGINGNDNESQHVQPAQSFRQSGYESSPFTLPKLMTNTQNRITSNFQGNNKYGTSVNHTRQNSVNKDSLILSPGNNDFSTANQTRFKDNSAHSKQFNPRGTSTKQVTEQSSFSKSINLITSNGVTAKTSNQAFGIMGQPASGSKGFQSLRTSQVGGVITPKIQVGEPGLAVVGNRDSLNTNVPSFPKNYSFKNASESEHTDQRYGLNPKGNSGDEEKPGTAYNRDSVGDNQSHANLLH